jgi:glutamate carboxypeptidase
VRNASQQPERQLQTYIRQAQDEMVAYLRELVLVESPSSYPESQAGILSILKDSFRDLGFSVQIIPGEQSGSHLLAHGPDTSLAERQLLIGHCDTVWPIGTLEQMPFLSEGDVLKGPGIYDMKAGLTQMVFALKAIHALDLEPRLNPVVFINSDEEIGSVESEQYIHRLAQEVSRVFVLEPALGLDGKLKTARKGIGRFSISIQGKAAHAGLDPGAGISAILELSYMIQKLYALNDPRNGITVNVGLVEGGIRPNVVAANSQAEVDVRYLALDDAGKIESAILNLEPEMPGVTFDIRGGISRSPLERTSRNQRLWHLARTLGERIGLQLEEGSAGGGSDGNITSQYAATLDGLGAVGNGAHANHEFVFVSKMVERSVLLALLILSTSDDPYPGN